MLFLWRARNDAQTAASSPRLNRSGFLKRRVPDNGFDPLCWRKDREQDALVDLRCRRLSQPQVPCVKRTEDRANGFARIGSLHVCDYSVARKTEVLHRTAPIARIGELLRHSSKGARQPGCNLPSGNDTNHSHAQTRKPLSPGFSSESLTIS